MASIKTVSIQTTATKRTRHTCDIHVNYITHIHVEILLRATVAVTMMNIEKENYVIYVFFKFWVAQLG